MHETLKLRDKIDAYFRENPDHLGRHWHQRKFDSKNGATRWYQWLQSHQEEHLFGPPLYAMNIRGRIVYITKRDEEGRAWGADGHLIPQPLAYRRSLERPPKPRTIGDLMALKGIPHAECYDDSEPTVYDRLPADDPLPGWR